MIGAMRHRLTFQRASETSDGLGSGGETTWTDAFTVWAEMWKVSGQERVEAARSRQNSLYRWRVRYHRGIEPSMRIKWVNGLREHYQEVLAVNPLDGRNEALEVIAEEKL